MTLLDHPSPCAKQILAFPLSLFLALKSLFYVTHTFDGMNSNKIKLKTGNRKGKNIKESAV